MIRRDFLKYLGIAPVAIGLSQVTQAKPLSKIANRSQPQAPMFVLPTGIAELDLLTGGLRSGELTVLAGRPSLGKTSVALSIATHIAGLKDQRIAYFSIEQSKADVVRRLVAQEARIHPNIYSEDEMSESEWERIVPATKKIAQLPLYVDDRIQPVSGMKKAIEALTRENGPITVVFVDYLQMIPHEKSQKGEKSRDQILADLKTMARDFNVPVVLTAQLDRVEFKFPSSKILRELHQIIQIRDVSSESSIDNLVSLHRESYFARNSQGHFMELHVLQDKEGRTGVARQKLSRRLGMLV